MKQTSFMMVILMVLLPVMAITDLKYDHYFQAERIRHHYDQVLNRAIHDGAHALIKSDSLTQGQLDYKIKINPMTGIEQFYKSLGNNLNAESKDKQAELTLYVPCLIVIDFDGFYVYGAERFVGENGEQKTVHILRPKVLFAYPIGDQVIIFHVNGNVVVYDSVSQIQLLYTWTEFEELPEYSHLPLKEIRIKVIADTIEKALTEQVNQHNLFAHQNGISYTFFVPQIDEPELVNGFSDIGMIAFFQGMPIGGTDRLNLYSFGGSRVYEKSILSGYSIGGKWIVCRKTCTEYLEHEPIQVFRSSEEAAKEGYYPCTICKP